MKVGQHQRPHRRRKGSTAFIAGRKKAMGWQDWHKLWTQAMNRKHRHLFDREAMKKPNFVEKMRDLEREEAVYGIATIRHYKREMGKPWQGLDDDQKIIRKYRWILGTKHKSRSGSKLTWAAGANR